MDINRLIEANKKAVDQNTILKRDVDILESRIEKALKIIEKYIDDKTIKNKLFESLKGDTYE